MWLSDDESKLQWPWSLWSAFYIYCFLLKSQFSLLIYHIKVQNLCLAIFQFWRLLKTFWLTNVKFPVKTQYPPEMATLMVKNHKPIWPGQMLSSPQFSWVNDSYDSLPPPSTALFTSTLSRIQNRGVKSWFLCSFLTFFEDMTLSHKCVLLSQILVPLWSVWRKQINDT